VRSQDTISRHYTVVQDRGMTRKIPANQRPALALAIGSRTEDEVVEKREWDIQENPELIQPN
jgi:hypothetical protein